MSSGGEAIFAGCSLCGLTSEKYHRIDAHR